MLIYRKGTESDNQQLIALTAASPMAGDISLRIDRSPDFFALLKLRGESIVFVAENNQKIIACICASRQDVFIGGTIQQVYYVGDFKVTERYRNKGVGFELTKKLEDYLISVDADLIFLNIAQGNNKPVPFFRKRSSFSDFENLGIFNIFQFLGKKGSKLYTAAIQIVPTEVDDSILTYLNSQYRKYELGSVIKRQQLAGCDIYKIIKNNKLAGVMCISDTMEIKQNVVVSISFTLTFILKIVNMLHKVFGISKMPELHQPVKMLYIKYIAVEDNNVTLVKRLINFAQGLAYDKLYSFASLGLHEKDPLNFAIKGMVKFTFHSVGMVLSLKNNNELIDQVKKGIPFEDYSLV